MQNIQVSTAERVAVNVGIHGGEAGLRRAEAIPHTRRRGYRAPACWDAIPGRTGTRASSAAGMSVPPALGGLLCSTYGGKAPAARSEPTGARAGAACGGRCPGAYSPGGAAEL